MADTAENRKHWYNVSKEHTGPFTLAKPHASMLPFKTEYEAKRFSTKPLTSYNQLIQQLHPGRRTARDEAFMQKASAEEADRQIAAGVRGQYFPDWSRANLPIRETVFSKRRGSLIGTHHPGPQKGTFGEVVRDADGSLNPRKPEIFYYGGNPSASTRKHEFLHNIFPSSGEAVRGSNPPRSFLHSFNALPSTTSIPHATRARELAPKIDRSGYYLGSRTSGVVHRRDQADMRRASDDWWVRQIKASQAGKDPSKVPTNWQKSNTYIQEMEKRLRGDPVINRARARQTPENKRKFDEAVRRQIHLSQAQPQPGRITGQRGYA